MITFDIIEEKKYPNIRYHTRTPTHAPIGVVGTSFYYIGGCLLLDSFATVHHIDMFELNWPPFNFELQFAIYVFGTQHHHWQTANLSILSYENPRIWKKLRRMSDAKSTFNECGCTHKYKNKKTQKVKRWW